MPSHVTSCGSPRRTILGRTLLLALVAVVAGLVTGSARADDTVPRRGDAAPPLDMPAVDGSTISWPTMRDRLVIVSFGESEQDRSRAAWSDISAVLATPEYRELPITWIVVLAKGSPSNGAAWFGRLAGVRPVIIRDEQREAFRRYGVFAVPTVTVIGRDGRIVHIIKGTGARFPDVLQDTIAFGLGRITAAEFERLLHPVDAREPTAAEQKALRHLHLADRLAARGMLPMAAQQYRDSIEADPTLIASRLGLGRLLVAQGRFDDAAAQFRDVLKRDPPSIDAAVGLAEALAMDDDVTSLEEAESQIETLLARDFTDARAHFVRGLLHERRGDVAAASRSFKTAASLLLNDVRDRKHASSPTTTPGNPE